MGCDCKKGITLKSSTVFVGDGEGAHGTGDYAALENKPSINGVTLEGDKDERELGIEINFASDEAIDALFAEDPIDAMFG